jgi:PilZ domain
MTNPLRKLWRAATPTHTRRPKNSESRPLANGLLLNDRRLVIRHLHPLPATLRYGIASIDVPVRIHNFSDKGLCFRGEVHLPIGAAVEITTALPQKRAFAGRKVRYLAHVVRVSREPGKFVTAALIFRCETLAQEAVAASGVTEPTADVSPEPATERKTEALPEALPVAPTPHQQHPVALTPRNSRQFSRYNCASQVQFRMPDGDLIMSGVATDLSLAGCYVQTSKPCPLGASVEIVVQAGGARIYTQGRVKAVKDNQGMAVEFVGDLAQRLQRLPRFVQMVAAGQQHNQQNN